jgi:hypothetical protein
MKRLMPCFATWSLATALGVTPLVVPLPAHAGVHVGIWLPGPPVVVGPPVLVVPPPVVYVAPPVIYGSHWYGSPGRSWHRHHHGHRRHHGPGRHHGGWHRH